MITAKSITDDQIRELEAEIRADTAWGGGGRGRAAMLGFCKKALESGIYVGARERVAESYNARPIMADCPRCLVAAGVRCTSLNRTGYSAILRPHPERASHAQQLALKNTRSP